MAIEEIFDKLKELVVDQLGVEEDEVTMEATMQDDLGADSLDLVDLVMSVEEEFGVKVADEDLENIKTKFDKGSTAVRGSGIGLALVDSIMAALDGTLDIKSTLGRGTVVTLGLPLYHKA